MKIFFRRVMDDRTTFKNILGVMFGLLFLILIFLLSNQNGSNSNKMTQEIAKGLNGTVFHNYKGDFIRLERKADTFTQYYSSDGVNWRIVDKSEKIKMNKTIYIGFMLTSHNMNRTSTAIFDHVSIKADYKYTDPKWQYKEIGNLGSLGAGLDQGGDIILLSRGYPSWERADECGYMFKEVIGDCSITARLKSIVETDNWALAGLMIRDNLEPKNKYASVGVTPRGFITPQWKDDIQFYLKWEHTSLFENNIKVRKSLHFIGYMVLTFVFYMSLSLFRIKKFKVFISTIILSAAAAFFDEFHQLFVPGRDAKVIDSLIDISGALLALIIITIITLLHRKRVQS